jgi:soluble lytic murein transglycosylase-like protein
MDWHLTRLERTTPTHVQKVLNVSEYVQRMNPTLKQDEARHIVKATFKWAGEFNLDPALILSIQAVESRFKQHAVSSAGALGLMQFIPSWHLNKVKAMTEEKKLANPDVFDPESNIFMGSWIMKDCMNVQKNVSKALLCYNGSLKSPNGYDEKVLTIYNQLKQQYRI